MIVHVHTKLGTFEVYYQEGGMKNKIISSIFCKWINVPIMMK